MGSLFKPSAIVRLPIALELQKQVPRWEDLAIRGFAVALRVQREESTQAVRGRGISRHEISKISQKLTANIEEIHCRLGGGEEGTRFPVLLFGFSVWAQTSKYLLSGASAPPFASPSGAPGKANRNLLAFASNLQLQGACCS